VKIALAQCNPTVGDFSGNTNRILELAQEAKDAGARLVLFPELAVCGYPPRDLLDFDGFVEKNLVALETISKAAKGISILCGHIAKNPAPAGKPYFNSAALLQDGKISALYQKQLLPCYDVFDEGRYFEAGKTPVIFTLDSLRFAVTICEDAWNFPAFLPRPYIEQPLHAYRDKNIDWILNISASPFSLGKPEMRLRLFAQASAFSKAPVIFCNQVGGNDELLFDGCSFVVNPEGRTLSAAKAFSEEIHYFDTEATNDKALPWPTSQGQWLYEALVLGTRDYMRKCGAKGACLGLSGGVDSSVCAAIATEALGKKAVTGVCLPTRYTSNASLEDAEAVAKALDMPFHVLGIETIFKLFENLWKEWFHHAADSLTLENVQPRIRMTILMALANSRRLFLLNTSNKSEIATGYATLYGDSSGALSILGDLTKHQVYQLAEFINSRGNMIIPKRVLERPPTAELRHHQTDQDTLPPYSILDPMVVAVVEGLKGTDTLIQEGFDTQWVEKFSKLHAASEYKRHQLPPVIRVSSRAFGIGRRIPVASVK